MRWLMLISLQSILLAGTLLSGETHVGVDKFDFYLGEFTTNELERNDPMSYLIEDGLIEAVFSTHSERMFYRYLDQLRRELAKRPDRLLRFERLDRELAEEFKIRLRQGKKKRLYYTAGGALAGALVGIPAGKWISDKGSRLLWITVPAGALAGGGIGFLLGDLMHVPDFEYQEGLVTDDLTSGLEELDEIIESDR